MKKRTELIQTRFYNDNPLLCNIKDSIESSVEVILERVKKGAKILLCGNGGSASDSDHIVGELMKGFDLKRSVLNAEVEKFTQAYGAQGSDIAHKLQKTIPAISLNQHAALSSAVQNDTDPEMIFAQQVYGYGSKNDVLIGISTSGNAQNVVRAMQVANVMGLTTIGLTGKTGGLFNDEAQHVVIAPAEQTYRVQEFHLAIYHYWCLYLESELFEA